MTNENLDELARVAEELKDLRENGLPPSRVPQDIAERRAWGRRKAI